LRSPSPTGRAILKTQPHQQLRHNPHLPSPWLRLLQQPLPPNPISPSPTFPPPSQNPPQKPLPLSPRPNLIPSLLRGPSHHACEIPGGPFRGMKTDDNYIGATTQLMLFHSIRFAPSGFALHCAATPRPTPPAYIPEPLLPLLLALPRGGFESLLRLRHPHLQGLRRHPRSIPAGLCGS